MTELVKQMHREKVEIEKNIQSMLEDFESKYKVRTMVVNVYRHIPDHDSRDRITRTEIKAEL